MPVRVRQSVSSKAACDSTRPTLGTSISRQLQVAQVHVTGPRPLVLRDGRVQRSVVQWFLERAGLAAPVCRCPPPVRTRGPLSSSSSTGTVSPLTILSSQPMGSFPFLSCPGQAGPLAWHLPCVRPWRLRRNGDGSVADYSVTPSAAIMSRPADQACPRCGEGRLVDEVVTGANSYRFCGACRYDWVSRSDGEGQKTRN